MACLAMVGSGAARADHIDGKLRGEAVAIMKDLEKKGYKNVGILKFQVQNGNTPPTLTAGKLNYVMATRLENALVMTDKPDAPIGITRGASAVAASKDKKASFLTAEGRQNLFKVRYPLAWGTQSVEVDAFLTGIVVISPDKKRTTIIVQAFDHKNLDLRKVAEFAVDTDLAILRDTNQNFVVARRTFNAWAAADDPDAELNKLAVENAVKENKPGTSKKMTLDDMKEYLDFQILFNDQPMDITPGGFVANPPAGQKMKIKVSAKVKLGLLLRVNGVNTLSEQRDEKSDLNEYSWWILEPGTPYMIRGFYKDSKVSEFVAKEESEVDLAQLGENAERHGKIDFDVFVNPTEVVKDLPAPKARGLDFSFRSVDSTPKTFEDLKKEIRTNLPVKKTAVPRSFFVPGSTLENQQLETTAFEGRHVGGITINYGKEPTK